MSSAAKDVSYFVVNAIYSALGGDNGLIYTRCDTITLSGTGTASVLNNGVTRTATSPTASDFVTANAAAYLAAGSILTSSGSILIFTSSIPGVLFTGSTTITNLTGTLTGVVAAANVTYPIYKTIQKNPASIYVSIGEVINREDGTKDAFIYYGNISITVCDESQTLQADKKKAQSVINIIRATLKPNRSSVPAGLIQFGHGGYNEFINLSDADRPKIRLTDVFDFILE